MKHWILALLLLLTLATPVEAVSYTAPTVPASGETNMPENTDSFSQALWDLVKQGLSMLQPELKAAARVCLGVFAGVLAVSVLGCLEAEGKRAAAMALTAIVSIALLGTAGAMVRLGAQTVREISDYSKLLFPVLAAALAAQGHVATSAALYTGTMAFDAVLCGMISSLLVPLVYLFLALAVANSAMGEGILKRMRELVKTFLSWSLKTVLVVFTTYISITGVVSGTTDAAALKATKLTISSVVPVVGGILSDASEAVLVSAGVMKNAAGVYGIIAMLAVLLSPFMKLGVQYAMLKATASVCGIFAPSDAVELIEDFSSAMGLLLAMTGAAGVMLLVSTVCFLKGVG